MKDGDFLELQRQKLGLTQKKMAELLKLNKPQAYQYYVNRERFTKSITIRFMEALKLKEWNPATPDPTNELKVLMKRLIKIESMVTGATIESIKRDIQQELDLLN